MKHATSLVWRIIFLSDSLLFQKPLFDYKLLMPSKRYAIHFFCLIKCRNFFCKFFFIRIVTEDSPGAIRLILDQQVFDIFFCFLWDSRMEFFYYLFKYFSLNFTLSDGLWFWIDVKMLINSTFVFGLFNCLYHVAAFIIKLDDVWILLKIFDFHSQLQEMLIK